MCVTHMCKKTYEMALPNERTKSVRLRSTETIHVQPGRANLSKSKASNARKCQTIIGHTPPKNKLFAASLSADTHSILN